MLRVIKRFVLAVIMLALITVGVGFFLIQRGVWGLDDWLVRQVVAIVETYIVPKITFTGFAYTAPGSIELSGVALTAPGNVEVVSADSLRVTLAEAPRRGKPIVIERIELDNPALRLIRPSAADAEKGVVFEGLVPFVRTDNVRNQSSVDEDVRLSSVLKIRSLKMTNGAVEYHEGPGRPPMTLTGVTMDLTIDPDTASAEPGWYRIAADLDRLPIFDLDLKAGLNLDTLDAKLERLRVRMDLGEKTYGSLPPQLQTLLREYDVVGKFEMHLDGEVTGRDPLASSLEAGIWIDELDFASGDLRYPIDEGRFEATLSDRRLELSRGFIEFLGGTINLTRLHADFSGDTWPTDLTWEASNLQLDELMRTAAPTGEPPFIAGSLASSGKASIDVKAGLPSITGQGEVLVTQGRFINFDLVRDLLGVIGEKVSEARSRKFSDTLLAKFDLIPEGLKITTFDMRAQLIAARGTGLIGFDTSVDAELNAGPLEKVQSMLGPIGKVMGAITDQLVKYRVTGKIGDVNVSVNPLGIR